MFQLDLGTNIHLFNPDGPNKDFLSNLKEIKREGFKTVELSVGKAGGYKVSLEKCIQEVGDGLKAVLDEGLALNSIHMPFARFNYISSYDEDVRLFVLDEFLKLIEICLSGNTTALHIPRQGRGKVFGYGCEYGQARTRRHGKPRAELASL